MDRNRVEVTWKGGEGKRRGLGSDGGGFCFEWEMGALDLIEIR